MALRSSNATIDFLLTAIDSVDGKVNWEAVAIKTGWYKNARIAKNAFKNIQQKYSGSAISNNSNASTVSSSGGHKKNPRSKINYSGNHGKKRTAPDDMDGLDDDMDLDVKKTKLKEDESDAEPAKNPVTKTENSLYEIIKSESIEKENIEAEITEKQPEVIQIKDE